MHDCDKRVDGCGCGPAADLREPARGAAERPEAHPLLLYQHLLLPHAPPRPQGGHQSAL